MVRQGEIRHGGRVVSIDGDRVTVEVEVGEACGACASRKACSMGRSDSRSIEVHTRGASSFAAGERVVVTVRRRTGMEAVAVGYLLPLAVLVAVLVCCSAAGTGDEVAAVAALGGVAIYYAVLWLLRDRISRRVSFGIEKIDNE